MTLDQAEEYGNCLTCPVGHMEAWEATKRGKMLLYPVDCHTHRTIAAAEYEEYPRGRIVFDRSLEQFIAYTDPQAMTHLPHISERFSLPQSTIFKCDLHYRTRKWQQKLEPYIER
jgi:hypothetical protein